MAGARAELALQRLLVGLLDSQYAEIMAAGLPVSTLLANSATLIKAHADLPPAEREKAQALLKDIERHLEMRNRLVHSILAIDQSTSAGQSSQLTAIYNTYRKPGRSQNITIEQASQTAEKLRSTADELLLWTFQNLPAASRQQVLPPS